MTTPSLPSITRRTALAAAAGALAWRPSFGAAPGSPGAQALHLLDRAAYGPAPGELERATRMGMDAWLDEQLHPERLPLPGALAQQLAALETPKKSQHELVSRYRELESSAKRAIASVGSASMAQFAAMEPADRPRNPDMTERRELVQLVHFEAGDARLLQALGSPRQLQEVMVEFWFNHFNVFDGKGLVKVLVESYEREAIRPNVFGRFRTMLGATAKHPAMLFYLDNWLSVAPGYQPRRRGGNRQLSGLNENYARELMELHTLGVDGGYTQADVTELARMLTGWTLGGGYRLRDGGMDSGAGDSIFTFEADRHDNGTKNWLGHGVGPNGIGEGEFALDTLARHPQTAKHIAFKLAQRFVADDPPPALVERVARRFLDTDGDLRAVVKAVIDSPEFRDPKYRGVKFKSPYQYVLSSVRATGIATTNVRPLMATMTQLGQPLFGCPTPDGYKDTESAWLNPSAITQRVNFATALASGRMPLVRLETPGKLRGNGEHAMAHEADAAQQDGGAVSGSTRPVEVDALYATLGPAIGEKTRDAVARSEPALRAALVLGSPDFMRR